MDYSPQSILFLHIAYIVIAVAQLLYGGWIAARWMQTRRDLDRNR